MEFENLIKKRASIRRYSDKKPRIENIIKLIEIANSAPSPGNQAILKYIIIENKEKIEKIAEACNQPFISQSKILIVICSESKATMVAYESRARKYIKQHAGAAIENLLLAITNIDMASCWVGAYSDLVIKRALEIPEEVDIEAVIPIGYQHKTDRTHQRKKPLLGERIFFEKWRNKYRSPFVKVGN